MNQNKKWQNIKILEENRKKARAEFQIYQNEAEAQVGQTSLAQSLNGNWKFLFLDAPEYSPAEFWKINYADQDWKEIEIPSTWQTEGYGKMHYTDVHYLFPIRPPYVPTDNPTGIYRRFFEIKPEHQGQTAILKFHGVDSGFEVWVNQQYVGYSQGSRYVSEFDITPLLVDGKNQITVRVVQWSDGTYLEDQDMWWLSGIFREVELLFYPDLIDDLQIHSDYDDENEKAELKIQLNMASTSAKEMLWLAELKDQNNQKIWSKEATGDLNNNFNWQVELSNILSWNAENPNLYELLIKEYKDNQLIAVISSKIGFRRIEVKDHRILLNGKSIQFHGVNYHDYDPMKGRVISKQTMIDDMKLMKEHNINAIRCSHYPKNDVFYQLCDQYGFYVIDEADLECHGFELTGDYNWLADDKDWAAAFIDRGIRMVASHRNHPSILMWSLGNESGFGMNFKVMAEAIRQLDSTRLIHYEGDFEAEITDVYSTMYTRYDKLIQLGLNYKEKPHILCEYAHAMGNGPGGLLEYERAFEQFEVLHGGFVWEWYDHGISSQKLGYAYGGDFGDSPTNGNFCIDGLLKPNREISSGLREYKAVIQPVECKVIHWQKAKIEIKNKYDFINLNHVCLQWEIGDGQKTLVQGEIENIHCEASNTVILRLNYDWQEIQQQVEANTEYYLDITFMEKEDRGLLKASHEIGKQQFQLPLYQSKLQQRTSKTDHIQVKEQDLQLEVTVGNCKYVFDRLHGVLQQITENDKIILSSGPKLMINRAVIDNDMYKKADYYEKFFLHQTFEDCQYFQWKNQLDCCQVEIHNYFSCLNQSFGFELTYLYTIYQDGNCQLKLNGKYGSRGNNNPTLLPRIGLKMEIMPEYHQCIWQGKGFYENYPDSAMSTFYGIYSSLVEQMDEYYVFPQENGHREGIRWLALQGNNNSLLIRSKQKIGMNVSYYTVDELVRAKHWQDLKKSDKIHLIMDYRHLGLGSNSCGEEQLAAYRLKPQDFTMDMEFRIVHKEKEIEEGRIEYA